MREFVFYSEKARTSGNWKDNDLMKAGRMDIVCNVIIQALSLSNKIRENIHLHLIFNGPPNNPVHLELISNKNIPISKKDVAGLIKRMLYKCNNKNKIEVFSGCFVEKKSLNHLLKEFEIDGKRIYILDSKGKFIRDFNDDELKDCVFVIGDHEGLPDKELKKYKERISVGNQIYFSSQVFIIINNELDIRIYND